VRSEVVEMLLVHPSRCVSLNSRLESNQEEEKEDPPRGGPARRGTRRPGCRVEGGPGGWYCHTYMYIPAPIPPPPFIPTIYIYIYIVGPAKPGQVGTFRVQSVMKSGLVGTADLGGVPREQKMRKGHLPRVTYHQVY